MFKASFIILFFCFLGYASAIGVCHLTVDKGAQCMGVFPSDRWGYHTVEHKCIKFTYGGCFGNANNYKTELECQKACHADIPYAK